MVKLNNWFEWKGGVIGRTQPYPHPSPWNIVKGELYYIATSAYWVNLSSKTKILFP